MPTRVVNIKYERTFDVYVGRAMPAKPGLPAREGSDWGNPYRIRREKSRDGVIEMYRQWLHMRRDLLARIPELRGKTLACWCRPAEGFQGRLMCHAQILAGLADGIPPEQVP